MDRSFNESNPISFDQLIGKMRELLYIVPFFGMNP